MAMLVFHGRFVSRIDAITERKERKRKYHSPCSIPLTVTFERDSLMTVSSAFFPRVSLAFISMKEKPAS